MQPGVPALARFGDELDAAFGRDDDDPAPSASSAVRAT